LRPADLLIQQLCLVFELKEKSNFSKTPKYYPNYQHVNVWTMLENHLLLVLTMLFAVSMLALLSEKLKVPYPIVLVLAGLIISFIPGVPLVRMRPDIIFLIFLPPLLYSAAWNTAWSEFWHLRRSIGTLAFGLVIFTATGIAFVSYWLIPNFSLAAGFLLGSIISPPDAIAATSVLQKLKIPRRVTTILDGESLLNDATSLIVFRFALISILTGQFIFWDAAVGFISVAIMGVVIGLAIGHMVYLIHKNLPTTAGTDTALTLITPYLMYLTAEHFHFSGVLAVVSGGLLVSYRSADIFAYNSRLQSLTVWSVLVFLLNGIVFILIGLQLPQIIKGIEGYSFPHIIFYEVIISLVTIIIRLFWVFTVNYLTRLLKPRRATREDRFYWKAVFIVGWSGMRGVVSLASALAIPLTLSTGIAFPYRSLILFITFTVILATLILQGLSLPFLLRWLKLETHENDVQQENTLRYKLAIAVIDYLERNCPTEIAEIPVFARVKSRYERMAELANKSLLADDDLPPSFMKTYRDMLLEIIRVRRDALKKMHRDNIFADHLIRAKERELDLEEARTRKT
jgi:Na+/H+ antiporter